LKASFKKRADKFFHLDSHKIAADGRAPEIFFFVKTPNSSRTSIFGNHEISTLY
jgi:hypothetical protein